MVVAGLGKVALMVTVTGWLGEKPNWQAFKSVGDKKK